MTSSQDSEGRFEALGATFAIEGEDHSLLGALRYFLNKNPHVDFCGYSRPHPADTFVNLRIQTTGLITPKEALEEACRNLKVVCAHMKQIFRKEMEANGVPIDDAGAADQQMSPAAEEST